MDSLVAQEGSGVFDQIAHFLVVNEAPTTGKPKRDWRAEVLARYPFVEFVQKDGTQSGQAKSLNLILQKLENESYDYWLHIEEAWKATRPFLRRALNIMDRNPALSQLQLNADAQGNPRWADWGSDNLRAKLGHVVVLPKPGTLASKQIAEMGAGFRWTDHPWPLFSLNPSMNRVGHLLNLGKFDERAESWPIVFEFDYGTKFVESGCVKAYLVPTAYQRDWKNHRSTYS
jgi:hypothetical protein